MAIDREEIPLGKGGGMGTRHLWHVLSVTFAGLRLRSVALVQPVRNGVLLQVRKAPIYPRNQTQFMLKSHGEPDEASDRRTIQQHTVTTKIQSPLTAVSVPRRVVPGG